MGKIFRNLTGLRLESLAMGDVSNPQLKRVLRRASNTLNKRHMFFGRSNHTDTRSHYNVGGMDGYEHENSSCGTHTDHSDHSDCRSYEHSDEEHSEYSEDAGHTDSEAHSTPHKDYSESVHTDRSKYD